MYINDINSIILFSNILLFFVISNLFNNLIKIIETGHSNIPNTNMIISTSVLYSNYIIYNKKRPSNWSKYIHYFIDDFNKFITGRIPRSKASTFVTEIS